MLTMLLSVLWFGHRLNGRQWLGVGLVFGGVGAEAAIQRREKAARERTGAGARAGARARGSGQDGSMGSGRVKVGSGSGDGSGGADVGSGAERVELRSLR